MPRSPSSTRALRTSRTRRTRCSISGSCNGKARWISTAPSPRGRNCWPRTRITKARTRCSNSSPRRKSTAASSPAHRPNHCHNELALAAAIGRCLARIPAHDDLLHIAASERFPLEVAVLVFDRKSVCADQQVQFLREEAADVEWFRAKIRLAGQAEVPLHPVDLRRVVIHRRHFERDRASAFGIFVLPVKVPLLGIARQDRQRRIEQV